MGRWLERLKPKPKDVVLVNLEEQLKEAQSMVEWHAKKLTHHQELVVNYTALIEKVKQI